MTVLSVSSVEVATLYPVAKNHALSFPQMLRLYHRNDRHFDLRDLPPPAMALLLMIIQIVLSDGIVVEPLSHVPI